MEAVNICECYDSNGTRIPSSSSKYSLKDKIVHTNIKEIYDREMREKKEFVPSELSRWPFKGKVTYTDYTEYYDKNATRLTSKYNPFIGVMIPLYTTPMELAKEFVNIINEKQDKEYFIPKVVGDDGELIDGERQKYTFDKYLLKQADPECKETAEDFIKKLSTVSQGRLILSQYAKKPEKMNDLDKRLPPDARQHWCDGSPIYHVKVDRILKDGIVTGVVSEYPKGLHMFMHKYGINAATN